jgi:tetratricopeptide (TPR) repeat protein
LKKLLFLLFSLFIYSLSIAQTVEETLNFGHEQYSKKQFDLAIQSYRRVLFFEPTQGKEVYSKLGFAYWEAYGDWKKSVYYFDLAYQISQNTEEQNRLIFTKIQVYLLAQKYHDVLLELMSLDETELTLFETKRKRFYQGIVFYQKKEYQKSENYFQECVLDSLSKYALHQVFVDFQKNEKRFRPKKIRTMSICLPGLGQCYCGKWKVGINSFLLTGGLATAFVLTGQGYTTFDALLTVMPWFQRYYSGGYHKAYQIAVDKIKEEEIENYQLIIKTIEESKQNK